MAGTYRGALSRIGGVGGYAGFEQDGSLRFYEGATTWDDLEGQLFAQKIESPASDITYNYADLTVDFDTDSEYDADFVAVVYQMRHRYVPESDLRLHLHWLQTENAVPNWLVAYRIIRNGAAPSSWLVLAPAGEVFTYTSGTILQITHFPEITGVDNLSFAIQVKLYRDTGNASTEFAGADAYTGDAQAVFMDIHFENDMLGSHSEFVK